MRSMLCSSRLVVRLCDVDAGGGVEEVREKEREGQGCHGGVVSGGMVGG